MRLIDGEELYGIVKLHDVDVVRSSRTASWLLDQILFDIHESPTISTEDMPRKAAHLVLDRYGVIKCDACGKCVEIGGKRTLHNPVRNEFSRTDLNSLPGWSSYFWACTLCPECSKDFRNVWDAFINTNPCPPSHEIGGD